MCHCGAFRGLCCDSNNYCDSGWGTLSLCKSMGSAWGHQAALRLELTDAESELRTSREGRLELLDRIANIEGESQDCC
eukprot:3605304-Amphidinium_carterae.1